MTEEQSRQAWLQTQIGNNYSMWLELSQQRPSLKIKPWISWMVIPENSFPWGGCKVVLGPSQPYHFCYGDSALGNTAGILYISQKHLEELYNMSPHIGIAKVSYLYSLSITYQMSIDLGKSLPGTESQHMMNTCVSGILLYRIGYKHADVEPYMRDQLEWNETLVALKHQYDTWYNHNFGDGQLSYWTAYDCLQARWLGQ